MIDLIICGRLDDIARSDLHRPGRHRIHLQLGLVVALHSEQPENFAVPYGLRYCLEFDRSLDTYAPSVLSDVGDARIAPLLVVMVKARAPPCSVGLNPAA